MSMTLAMSAVERETVPLKTRCSRKCDAPPCSSDSTAEPLRSVKPRATERTYGSVSMRIVNPDGRTCRVMDVELDFTVWILSWMGRTTTTHVGKRGTAARIHLASQTRDRSPTCQTT